MTDLQTLAGRVLSRCTANPVTGCWLCTYSCPSGSNAPALKGIDKKFIRADAVMYEYSGGKIPPGWILLHACNEPACVNPDHMRTALRRRGAPPPQKTYSEEEVREKIRALRSATADQEKTSQLS